MYNQTKIISLSALIALSALTTSCSSRDISMLTADYLGPLIKETKFAKEGKAEGVFKQQQYLREGMERESQKTGIPLDQIREATFAKHWLQYHLNASTTAAWFVNSENLIPQWIKTYVNEVVTLSPESEAYLATTSMSRWDLVDCGLMYYFTDAVGEVVAESKSEDFEKYWEYLLDHQRTQFEEDREIAQSFIGRSKTPIMNKYRTTIRDIAGEQGLTEHQAMIVMRLAQEADLRNIPYELVDFPEDIRELVKKSDGKVWIELRDMIASGSLPRLSAMLKLANKWGSAHENDMELAVSAAEIHRFRSLKQAEEYHAVTGKNNSSYRS